MSETMRKSTGITLILLVITIVIMLILGGTTINMIAGEEGVLKQSQQTQDAQKNYVNQEDTQVNSLINNMSEELKEDWQDPSMANKPVLGTGMIPVKWNGSNWVVTDAKDEEWFNYQEKRWANIMLTDGLAVEGITDVNTATIQEMKGKKVTAVGSMFVWIPRYGYQISTNYHNGGAGIYGTINIEFMKGTTNESVTGRTTWNNSSGQGHWNIHPAFDYNGTVEGIWVAKFEASHTGCTTGISTGQTNTDSTSLTLQVKPGVTSWRSIRVSNIFTVCQNYNTSLNSHLMKNSEWGAVAYLAQSSYGKNKEVWINNSSSFITGSAGSSASAEEDTGTTNDYTSDQGQEASTTGNEYGIYDMSGGATEYIAAYVNNGTTQLTSFGSTLINAPSYMKDVYDMSSTDSSQTNYEENKDVYGDAVYETSLSSSSTYRNSWYQDYSGLPWGAHPVFARGRQYNNTSYAGMFAFSLFSGGVSSSGGFRPVLIVF